MGLVERTIRQKAVTLTEKGVPEKRAEMKAEGTVVGVLSAVSGILLSLSAAGTVLTVALKGAALTWAVGAAVGVIGLLGLFIFAVGMTLISRDASPVIGSTGEFLVKLVRAARGKNGER